jgi:hypothetical protein
MMPSDESRDWVVHQLRGLPQPAPGILGDRRERADRRHRVFWSVVYGSFNPRRRKPSRRLGDTRFQALDWHAAHLLVVSIAILVLSVFDAFLTLVLMSIGAEEANPVMALVVHRNAAAFASLKMGMTGLSVILMVVLSKYRFMRLMRVEVALYGVLGLYLCLIAYEIWMVGMMGGLPVL